MENFPPKKKLCQMSIKDMLIPLSSSQGSAACGDKKEPASSASVDSGSTSQSHATETLNTSGATRMDLNTEHKDKGGESGKDKEKCAGLRDLSAKAAEQRLQRAATSLHNSAADNGNSDTDEKEWLGVPLSSLACLSATNPNLPPVVPSPDHTVLVRVPVPVPLDGHVPPPFPLSYHDTWDHSHVRMPCSPRSQHHCQINNSPVMLRRWFVVTEALSREIKSVEDLENAVFEYNRKCAPKLSFNGLRLLLQQEFEEEERAYFFYKTLPAVIKLALKLPQIVTQAPPLLKRDSNHSVTLSQMQIACLLANAFLCTFPKRNGKQNHFEYNAYPDINFNWLLYRTEQRCLEKLKCLLHYFRRVTTKPPCGLVTFSRQSVASQLPAWKSSKELLPRLHVSSSGLIEEADGLLQVDFANKYIGGGVLRTGCVQEEIRFVLCPELIISRLFTQALHKTEALIITGCEQYSRGSGYASSFRWEGAFTDTTPLDEWGRRLCQVTAIDAHHFGSEPHDQYKAHFIDRELTKAYAGFKVIEGSLGVPTAVATGNWGCGAFNGDPKLKALIQLAVCGHLGRDVAYFTFGDEPLRDSLFTTYTLLKDNGTTVGELTQALHWYSHEWAHQMDLFQYLHNTLKHLDSDTDVEASQEAAEVQVASTTTTTTTTAAEAGAGHSHSHSSGSCSGPSHSSKTPSRGIADCFPPPGRTHQRPLNNKEILDVILECDLLFENEKFKKKQKEHRGRRCSEDNSSQD